MKGRSGQVALYLALVLVAIAVLMLMNVSAFLAVRSKNRMMNAVDEAALAAAKVQGDLLNQVGWMNVDHLRHAIDNKPWPRMDEQRDLVFLRPLDAMTACARTAEAWGFQGTVQPELAETLRQHLNEIISDYIPNPDLYPEYRENQWADYAQKLGTMIGAGLTVSPGYLESANAWTQVPLLSAAFYDAIAARAWCWFSLGGRERFFACDRQTMPRPTFSEAAVQENSEIFSLHVTFRTWRDSEWAAEMNAAGEFSERWTNFICRVTGRSRQQVANSTLIADPNQRWAFYDDKWGRWSRTFNTDNYPIAGNVLPEYDVAGCCASCLMVGTVSRLLSDGASDDRRIEVTAEAKPFGTVAGLDDGRAAPVTSYGNFIAPSAPEEKIFTEAQLVLMGSVPRSPGVALNPVWYRHVKDHLPDYFNGGVLSDGCYYCKQLNQWENPAFRRSGQEWLNRNRGTCTVGGGAAGEVGGYDCAH